jgi:hypothetical protein
MCSSARWRQLRLPFAIERTWIEPVLRRDPALADAYQRLFAPAPRPTQLPAPPTLPDQATALAIQPLTEREQEALITGGDSAPLIPGSGGGV